MFLSGHPAARVVVGVAGSDRNPRYPDRGAGLGAPPNGGKHDPYVPVKQAERQRATFPSAEIVVMADSGHWPFVDNPDRVEDLVVGFLRRIVGSPARAAE